MQALMLFDSLGDPFHEQLSRFLHDPENVGDLDFDTPPTAEVIARAKTMAEGAWAQRTATDSMIQALSPQWSLARMSPVDRNILRLGVYELRHPLEIPVAVAIDEAIELAKSFGGSDSPAFVNGILDAVRKKLVPENTA